MNLFRKNDKIPNTKKLSQKEILKKYNAGEKITFEESTELIDIIFPDNDDDLLKSVEKFHLAYLIKKISMIFAVAFISSVAIELILLVLNYVFVNSTMYEDVFLSNGVWFYFGLLALLGYRIYLALSDKYDFKVFVVQKLVFSIALALISWVFSFNQNITSYFGNIVMMDDLEYVESDDDYDPIYGSSSGGYSGEFRFFLPINSFVDDKFIKDDLVFQTMNSSISITKSDDEFFLNTRKVLFWEYAFCNGYEPLIEQHKVESKSLFFRMLNITPKYFLELFINTGVKGIVFSLYILVLFLWGKINVFKR